MSKQQYIEQFVSTISQLRRLLESTSHVSHLEKAATIMQYSALKFFKNSKDNTVGDLAKHLKLSKSSATQLIERLEKTGLVRRTHDQHDRRIVRLTVTAEGLQRIVELKKKYLEKMGKIFSNVPDNDLQELVRIHKELIETLQKEDIKL
jgi:DNA-binding MarR family transcriptional regulator